MKNARVSADHEAPRTWDEAFAENYEQWSSGMKADVDFYVELAKEAPEGLLVELAVGDGRVAVPVAQATGRKVVGVDMSPAMLRRGRARAKRAGVELDLREGDMSRFEIDEPAALIYCPFRALFHLPTWADRRRTFERVAASLSPNGRFAWDAWALDHRLAASADGKRGEKPRPYTLRYAVGDNRVDLTLDDGSKSSMWWATKNEWLGLIDVSGLEVEALYAGFDRTPYAEDSGQYIFVTRLASVSRL